jgi:glycosyltransferase involved in cell wall biosynthesis
MKERGGNDTILFMGTYPPRECGIATFTKDLVTAVDRRLSRMINTGIIAINRNGVNIYNYPKKVQYEISDTDLNDYIEVAEQINARPDVKLICIQHEFGIFGGDWGDHLLMFLEKIKKPIVVTFHSVLPNPDDKLYRVVREIGKKVEEIIVMTQAGVEILRNSYGLENQIQVVPHGIPTTTFEDQSKSKARIGVPQDRKVICTFGMVGPGKGYEDVIEALPEIVKEFPDVLYIIVGETHPNVRKESGEAYRNKLTERVVELGLENNVKFYNKYVTIDEIILYVKAADVYVCPPQNPNQITSGTLVYAMGCGRAIVSTPFLHAKDIVTEKKGFLAEFNNPSSFAEPILKILRDPEMKKSMESHAYHETREMTWPNVAFKYCGIFDRHVHIESEEAKMLPKINTTHLSRLTDGFGVIQFSNQWIPDVSSGYTLDDNARALLVCVKHFEKFREYKQLNMIRTYLNYFKHVQDVDGRLYNFVNKDKAVDKNSWGEDAQGRAIWALGYLIDAPHIPVDFKREAHEIFVKAIGAVENVKSPRAVAFIIQGLYHYDKEMKHEETKRRMTKFADHLVDLYEHSYHESWKWFEKYLTYGNSKLSEALFYAYAATGKQEYLDIANESLKFLIEKTFENGVFVPIGQNGWYERGGERQYYDQQPIEAAYMVDTLIAAYKITDDDEYRKRAFQAFKWFTGENTLKQVVYNENTGGCHDGLGERTINLNQGAESTIAYLLARLNMMDV